MQTSVQDYVLSAIEKRASSRGMGVLVAHDCSNVGSAYLVKEGGLEPRLGFYFNFQARSATLVFSGPKGYVGSSTDPRVKGIAQVEVRYENLAESLQPAFDLIDKHGFEWTGCKFVERRCAGFVDGRSYQAPPDQIISEQIHDTRAFRFADERDFDDASCKRVLSVVDAYRQLLRSAHPGEYPRRLFTSSVTVDMSEWPADAAFHVDVEELFRKHDVAAYD